MLLFSLIGINSNHMPPSVNLGRMRLGEVTLGRAKRCVRYYERNNREGEKRTNKKKK